MGNWAVAAGYAIWFFAIEAVYYLSNGTNENALQIVVLGGAIPATLQLFLVGVDFRGLVSSTKISLYLMLTILLSYLVNAVVPSSSAMPADTVALPATWLPLVFTLNTAFVLAVSILLAGSPDRDLLRSTAALFCYFNAPFLLYACLAGDYVYGRLNANDIGPNIWGSFGLFLCVCAIGRKFNALTLSFFLIGLYTIYASSSRTSMTAIAAAGLVLLFCFIAEIRGWTIPTTLFAAIGTTLAVTIFFDPYVLDLVDFVTNGLLKLDSTDRGVGSGFTGRSTIWAETLQLWINSPLLGVGFRQHEALLPGGMSAHNAYLAMLADMGMAGLLLYVGLIASALFAAMSITDRANRRFILAIIASYIAYGFFERRAINSGNPYSLIFLFACFYALSDRSLRSARLIG